MHKYDSLSLKIISKYTLFGVIFGILFPIGAIAFELLRTGEPFSLSTISLLHFNNNLLFMIDTAPLFLGIFAYMCGIGQARSEALRIELEKSNDDLEDRVKTRTQELSETVETLTATQEELIRSERIAALGNLVAGVAHEINTPLGAIKSSVENMSKSLKETLDQLPTFFQVLPIECKDAFFALVSRSLEKNISITAKEERAAKRALRTLLDEHSVIDSDMTADILVDMGIYDNIDQFISIIKSDEKNTILNMAYTLSSIQRSAQTIKMATERASKVVFALKTYAHHSHSNEMVETNIEESIETVLTLYHNQIKHGVEVLKEYDKIPFVACYPDELIQVWTNLIHNALQAMDYKGTLTINISLHDKYAAVSITDSGSGIPGDVMANIFQPFYTTKRAGEGSGLGLVIVKKIVGKHCGRIEVESIPGRTRFTVFIPIEPNEA